MKKEWRTLWCVLFAMLFAGSAAATGYTQTRYPVVLVHGFSGFDSILGNISYWPGVDQALRDGGATVYVASVSSFNASTARGEQLIVYLDDLRALHGYQRFNLIGHSQGSPTIRYVASTRPDLVASVTAVGGSNLGWPLADLFDQTLPEGSPWRPIVAGAIDALGVFIGAMSGHQHPQDVIAAMAELSTAGADDFNRRFPEGLPATYCGSGPSVVNGIYYSSFTGTGVVTNLLDPSDAFLAATSLVFLGEASDGLVSQCASHLGEVLRDDYPWNHLDETNLLFGLRGVFAPDVPTVYRAHVNRLKNRGL